MAVPRKKTSKKSAPRAAKTPEEVEESTAKARKSASKGGTKSAQAKQKAASAARNARPTNPDAMEGDVIELITAVDEYKRKNQRPFPSWSEILDIVKGLGYGKSA